MPFVSRKKLDAMKKATEELLKTVNDIQDRAYIFQIDRIGRVNKFTFMRGEHVYQIETMGLIGDNLPEWKEKLLR